jgi:nicotinamidase-related amidase
MEKSWKKYCLLVVDMQKGIFGLKQPVYEGGNLIKNVKEAVRSARNFGIKVIFSRHGNDTFLQ